MNDQATSVVLTIAGTDPSSAAGIQADLQVFRDHGLHGASVITAVLWQNTREVAGYRVLPAAEIGYQLDAILEDIPIAAVKVGMVPNEKIAWEIVSRFENSAIPVVVDTVFTSGSGKTHLTRDKPRLVSDLLLPIATVATPNAREAAQILERDVTTENALEAAAELRERFGPISVLLKAGHMNGQGEIRDVFADLAGARWMRPLERITVDVRGTGCQLSSAIAAGLANERPVERACEDARVYLNELLLDHRRAIGKGREVIVRD